LDLNAHDYLEHVDDGVLYSRCGASRFTLASESFNGILLNQPHLPLHCCHISPASLHYAHYDQRLVVYLPQTSCCYMNDSTHFANESQMSLSSLLVYISSSLLIVLPMFLFTLFCKLAIIMALYRHTSFFFLPLISLTSLPLIFTFLLLLVLVFS
jgi:hypothetical protein